MIRAATPDDAAAIADLHAETHRATYAPLIDGPYEAPPVPDWPTLLAGPGLTFVALEADRLAGFAHASNGRIEPLYIAAAHHRRGIGTALFRTLLAGMNRQGVRTARFNVLAGNARAIAFYEALGAQQVGTEVMTDAPLPYLDIVFQIDTAI